MAERYPELRAVIADTFPDIHWKIASRESTPIFYGYLDGWKYKLPEYVTAEGTEEAAEADLIATLRDWWARRPALASQESGNG